MKNSTNDWYTNYRKSVVEQSERLCAPYKEIPQNLLWLKAAVIDKLEKSGIQVLTSQKVDQQYGFIETAVDQLMTYAYNEGMLQRDKKSYDEGVNAAWKEVAKRLDLYTDDDINTER